MSNLNGRLSRIEAQLQPPATAALVHLGADGSIGLYQNGRLVSDLGAILAKINGHEPTTPAPVSPGPAGPETLHEMIARIWGSR